MRTDFIISPTYLAGIVATATPEELEDGRTWYEREGEWVRATGYVYDCTPEQVAAITSVLSSNAPWDEAATAFPHQHNNKLTVIQTLDILCDRPDALEGATLFATQRQRRICREIYETPQYQPTRALGPKCFPFACNLLGDYEQFTLDQMGWAAVIGWLGTLRSLPAITPKRRDQAEAAYCWLAEALGVTLAQAQAMAWVPIRRIRKELRA